MHRMKIIHLPLLLVLLSMLTLAACSEKTTDNKTSTAKTSTTKTTPSKSGERPALGQSYTALYAKAKETVNNAVAKNPKNFRENQQYLVLPGNQPLVGNGEKIEVVEFFSYACPACFRAESSMHAYAEQVKDDVEFIRVPVSFNPQYETLARGYYAAEALGVDKDAHLAIFDAIHVKRQNMFSVSALANLYSHYGVDKSEFKKAFKSFGVNASIQRDKKLTQGYQVSGVPTVIVNGKYNTGGRMAGTMDTWVQILDYLTDKERIQKSWTKKSDN